MNAIIDALWRAFRISHLDMPATPERVWNAIQDIDRVRALARQTSWRRKVAVTGSRGLSRTLPNILGGQMTWGQIEDRSGPLHDAGVKDVANFRALRSVDRITMLPETFVAVLI